MKGCDVCGGKLHRDNLYGVCKRNPECKNEWWRRRWDQMSEDGRERQRRKWRSADYLTVTLRNARQRAKEAGVPFSLTRIDAPPVPAECPCCGTELIRGGPWRNQPSLDRLIPERGYVPSNIQWLCRRCNLIKSNATADELMRMALFLKGVA